VAERIRGKTKFRNDKSDGQKEGKAAINERHDDETFSKIMAYWPYI